jgi:release factor glutamine methyltransferase
MDVREALAYGKQRLEGGDSDTPALDAEVLLRHVLGVERVTLLTHPERSLSAPEEQRFVALVERRARDEPIAYITGRREFMALEFAVDRRVLVPRPDTEVLVERALELLGSDGAGATLVDVGTGSGAIAVSAAALRPHARVFGIDVSAAALTVARVNAARLLRPPAAVTFLQGSLLQPLLELKVSVTVICANLPYIPRPQMKLLPATVRDHEPEAALDGGPDGLDLYRELLPQAREALAPGGTLLMECDPGQAAALLGIGIEQLPGAQGSVIKDLAGLERVVEVRR